MSLFNIQNGSYRDRSGRELFNRHVDWCFYAIVAVSLIILFKTGILQLTDFNRAKSENMKLNHLTEKWVIPARGKIVDRNGVLLATSLLFQTVAMDPYKVRSLSDKRRRTEFETLEKILGVPVNTLEELSSRRVAMVPVKRAVGIDTEAIIKEYIRKGLLPGIELVTEQVREYPWEDCTRAILGVVRGSSDILLKFKSTNRTVTRCQIRKSFPWHPYSCISGATPQRGVGGVEQYLDPWLTGSADRYLCHLDRNLNPMKIFTEKIETGKAPCSVVLTIDIHLQRFVARLIQDKVIKNKASLGMVVAMDALSGEILAAYSASFHKDQLISDDCGVFTSSFEPGSVAKPLMTLYAFTLGVIDENDRFNCNLPATIGGKTYRDEHLYDHDLSPGEIISVSSDSGMAQIIKKMIQVQKSQLTTDIVNFYKQCGLGRNISVNHTAISRSALPSPGNWTSVTPSQLAIGYEFEVSPFHLASIYSGFANGEKISQPILVKKVVDENGATVREFCRKSAHKECFPRRYASLIHGYLKTVVSAKEGTGRQAAVEGVEIAGKTGTARRLVNGRYSRNSHNSTFMGILPLHNSYIIIGVFFQDIKKGSDYGGAACAPVFREIAEYIIDLQSST